MKFIRRKKALLGCLTIFYLIALAACPLSSAGPEMPASSSESSQARPSWTEDLTQSSGCTVRMLEAGLRGELIPYAADFLQAETQYKVNAFFLAALAALESGWGAYCHQPNNLFGWGQQAYPSKSVCIDAVARAIAEDYLTPGGRYFHGVSLEAVGRCYNNNPQWTDAVAGLMAEIEQTAKAAHPPEDIGSSSPASGEDQRTQVGGMAMDAFRF